MTNRPPLIGVGYKNEGMNTLIDDIIIARTLTAGQTPDVGEIGAVAAATDKKSTKYKAIARIKEGRITPSEAANLSQWCGLSEGYLLFRPSMSEEGQYWEICRILTNRIREVREVSSMLTE